MYVYTYYVAPMFFGVATRLGKNCGEIPLPEAIARASVRSSQRPSAVMMSGCQTTFRLLDTGNSPNYAAGLAAIAGRCSNP